MIIAMLIFLAVMLTGFYFYLRQNRPGTSNRYRMKKPSKQPVQLKMDFQATLYGDEEDNDVLGVRSLESQTASAPSEKPAAQSTQSDCIIALYLMAPEESPYTGYELLQALLSSGMRYGKHSIFHRHAHKDGRGEVLFHCASATAPGTFDLSKMGAFSCKGLSLFFAAKDVEDPLSTFDCLLETIDQLVEDLGGKVLDAKRELFTKEVMVKYRQELRTFEASKTTADLFA